FADRTFDVASVAFGLRNVVLPASGISEIARTLKPGGRLIVLEFFAPPDGPGARAFRLYFRHVLPCIGRLVTGAAGVDAYRYLPDSVEAFARPEQVAGWLADCGLIEPRCERFLFGAVALLSARRAPARQPAPDGVPAACYAGA